MVKGKSVDCLSQYRNTAVSTRAQAGTSCPGRVLSSAWQGMHPVSSSSFSSLSFFLSHLTVFIIEYSEVRNLGTHSLCLIVFPNVRSWLGNELRGGNNFSLRHFRSIFLNFQKAVLSCLLRNTGFSPPHWVTVSFCKIYCFGNILFYFSL